MKLTNILPTLMRLESISPKDLHAMISNDPVTILDVNVFQSWQKAHVPGAIHLDPLGYTENDLPDDKNSALVFYCSNPMCRKAPNAARKAEGMGYKNVLVMSAGINGWLSAGLPTEMTD